MLELKGHGCRQFESYLIAQGRDWYDFFVSIRLHDTVLKRIDLLINDDLETVLGESMGGGVSREDCICIEISEPLTVEESITIDELERLYELYQQVKGTIFESFIYPVSCIYFGGNALYFLEHLDEFEFYGVSNITEFARYIVSHKYGKLTDELLQSIDYEAMGKDLYGTGDYYINRGGGIVKVR